MEIECEQLLKVNYQAIQDKNQLENLIVQHKAVIANLIKQIHQLINIKDKEQLERDIILNKMQENMLQNTRQIINFKNMINQTTEEHHKLSKQFDEQKEKLKKNVELQHIIETNELTKRLQDLQSEYRQLQEIEEKEANYNREIKKLKEELVMKQYQHHDNMNKEEKKQIKQNIELNRENQNKIVEVKKNIFHVAKNIVIEEKYGNEDKNNQLKTKLLHLQRELASIKKNRNQILEKRKQLKINLSLNQEELEQYKAVGSLQKAKIKAAKDKVDNLKTHISEELEKRQNLNNELKKKKGIEAKTLSIKLKQLQIEREEMKINLEKMKVLAETILMQRQQVQQFFIMSLENCKKEIERQNQGSLAAGREKTMNSYGEKVDIEELAPKDKQRILTNLYTKLALGP